MLLISWATGETMKVGVLSLGWPPAWAGGETYLYRIVEALNQQEVDAWGITATPAHPDYDNGIEKVIRITPPFAPPKVKDSIRMMFYDEQNTPLKYHAQLDRMETWAQMINEEIPEDSFDVGIIYVENLTSINAIDYRELFGRPFKKLVSISFDFDYLTILNYEKETSQTLSLLDVIEAHKDELKSHSNSMLRNLLSRHYNPEMEGIIHLTHFNQQVVNTVFGTKDHEFVLHPLLEDKWFNEVFTQLKLRRVHAPTKVRPEDFVIGIVNPIGKKGVEVMPPVIAQTPYKFRILEGGHQYGDRFLETLQHHYQTTFPERVEMIHYVEDIVGFFDSIDALFMPSMIEGYGQVAHEALMRGIPVLTKRFPTIEEATMGHALFVEPENYHDSKEWREGLDTIFQHQAYWNAMSYAASIALKERQEEETEKFVEFLKNLTEEE